LFLFNDETWEKNEGVYLQWSCAGQKNPSVSPNSSPAGRNISRKIRTITEKRKSGKKGLEDGLDYPSSWYL
jgi:hypothetical protein